MWVARIRWRVDGIQQELYRSLDTPYEDVADIRMIAIRENERILKRGEKISFPWENDKGKV